MIMKINRFDSIAYGCYENFKYFLSNYLKYDHFIHLKEISYFCIN